MNKRLLIGTTVILLLTGCSNSVQVETAIAPTDVVVEEVTQTELIECLVDTCDLEPMLELSDYERWVVECMVMGEAEGESWEGKAMVAYCILNGCIREGVQPSELRTLYKYSGWKENPSQDVKTAVTAVFDDGHEPVDDIPLWFYAPKYVSKTPWHESQRYICTIGGHKFFGDW